MSLQVWLPLNGDLHNLGLSDITVTNNGATVNTSGKIGNCYGFDKSIPTYLKLTNPIISNNSGISFAFWIKVPANASGNNLVIHIGNGAGWNNNRCTCFIRSGTSLLVFTCGDGTDSSSTHSTQYNCISNAITLNQWTHVVCSYITGLMKIYINGIENKNYTTTIAPNVTNIEFIGIGAAPNAGEPCTCYLNDVRIYDHALSAKEVEEIAKGLVLHYKLDDIYSESTTNLITTVDGLSNTCYNGATGKYSYGTNTDMYKTTGIFLEKFCTKVYMGTAGNDAYPYVYFDPFNAKGTEIQTVSFDYYPTILDTLIPYSYNGTYNFSYTSNGIPGSATNASLIIIPVNVGQWNHITITAQKYDTTSTSRGIGYVRIGSAAHTSTTTDYWLFANVQVEAKDHTTGYAGVGGSRVATTIYDSSGYGNDGTIIGNLTIDSNSPRYNIATAFDGTNAIKYTNFNLGNIWSAGLWFNAASGITSGWDSLFAVNSNGGDSDLKMNLYLNTATGSIQYSANGLYIVVSAAAPNKDSWYHIFETFDGTTLSCYVNGVLKTTKTITNTEFTRSNLYISGRSSSTNGSTSANKFHGKLSDFRIYATALSADDILELYNTSMSIDNNGNIHVRELVEL